MVAEECCCAVDREGYGGGKEDAPCAVEKWRGGTVGIEIEGPACTKWARFVCSLEEVGGNPVVVCSEDGWMWGVSPVTGDVLWDADVCSVCGIETNEAARVAVFCAAPEALFVGLESGEMLLVYVGGGDGGKEVVRGGEEVGAVRGGIAAAAWSPDGSCLALVGGHGQFMLMNSQWDVLMEVSALSYDDCADPQPTAAPEPEVVAMLSSDALMDSESYSGGMERFFDRPLTPSDASVSWRGDGKFVSTCVRVDSHSPGRIRVWDVEGQMLHSIGEQSPGIIPAIAWQPNGRVLCVANSLHEDQQQHVGMLRQMTTERGAQGQDPEVRHVGAWKRELRRRKEAAKARGDDANHGTKVFLYEKNGLQHGEFSIPGAGVVCLMEWSPNSQLLSIVLEDGSTGSVEHVVQVWCRSNWKWYMKWARRYKGLKTVATHWQDTENGIFLCILRSNLIISRIKFAWNYNVSSQGTMGVVDGASILVTPMRHCIMPPPLCALEVVCKAPVIAISFRIIETCEAIAALLLDGSIAVVKCDNGDDWESMIPTEERAEDSEDIPMNPKLSAPAISYGQIGSDFSHRHICWVDDTHVAVVGQTLQGEDVLVEVELAQPVHESPAESTCLTTKIDEKCVKVFPCTNSQGAIVGCEGGSCYLYEAGGILSPLQPGFGSTCEVAATAPSNDGNISLVGLDRSGVLYFEGQAIAKDVTSFAIHHNSPGGPSLVYTLRSHFMRTLGLKVLRGAGVPMIKSGDVTVRSIEEGAVLLACPWNTVDVVLQAPRGNLEVIRPRALVLPAVGCALESKKYKNAWTLATVNRLDLNILADYEWPTILEEIGMFMEAVGSDTDIAGFLQALNPNNVCGPKGLYSSVLPSQNEGEQIENKVPALCEAIREYIERIEDPMMRREWLCTELSSYAKCDQLGNMMLRIKQVKEDDLRIIKEQGLDNAPKITAETGLKHVLLHTPDNDVYKAALGEYEIELAYMVITHSQVSRF